jgi:hypothetical protein
MENNRNWIESTPKGIFEALTNGLWPTEEALEKAEQERMDRLVQPVDVQ